MRQYATEWKRLGVELGLKNYDITKISENYEHHPKKIKVCFTAMLEQWLKMFPSPTWGVLEDAINKIGSSRMKSFSRTGTYVCVLYC